jgi:CyaY protein
MSAAATPSGLTDAQYEEAVRSMLAHLERTADAWLEDDVIDIDTARTGLMLTLSLPDRSQLIINAQPPLHELWLAARRGGFHFRLNEAGEWLDTRTGESFADVLTACASEQAGRPLAF